MGTMEWMDGCMTGILAGGMHGLHEWMGWVDEMGRRDGCMGWMWGMDGIMGWVDVVDGCGHCFCSVGDPHRGPHSWQIISGRSKRIGF